MEESPTLPPVDAAPEPVVVPDVVPEVEPELTAEPGTDPETNQSVDDPGWHYRRDTIRITNV